MNFEQIRYFLAIADTGLMHRAASEAGVSQPALTKSLRRLEAELDVPLFERNAKGMRLTPYGEAFVDDARALLALHEESLRRLGELHAAAAAGVEAGATPATEPLIDRAFATVLLRRPALRLHLRVELSDQLIESLEAGQIDFALAPLPDDLPASLAAETLFEESSWVVCREGHPVLARMDPTSGHVPPASLADYAWVLPRRSVLIRRQVDAWFGAQGLGAPRVQSERHVSGSSSVFNLIASTDLLGICSTQFQPLAVQYRLREVPSDGARWPRHIALLRRAACRFSPLVQQVVEAVRSEAKLLETLAVHSR